MQRGVYELRHHPPTPLQAAAARVTDRYRGNNLDLDHSKSSYLDIDSLRGFVNESDNLKFKLMFIEITEPSPGRCAKADGYMPRYMHHEFILLICTLMTL